MPASDLIKRAEVTNPNESAAAGELAAALAMPDPAGVIFFCSPEYDPERLTEHLNRHFDCPLIGCTSAGEIGSHYQTGGIVGIALSAEAFALHSVLIDDLDELDPAVIGAQIDLIERNLRFADHLDPERMFSYLLIDGLSLKEEMAATMLHSATKGLHMLGGSAGDGLNFTETRIFAKGEFRSHRAVLAIIETSLDFEIFKLQHFEPADQDMVVTDCIPNRRIVNEIDGGPAAAEYARIIGLDTTELGPQTFSMHPVMLEIGNEWYVRSIEKVNDDGSLTFYCAIDNGLPLTLARGNGLVSTLQAQVAQLQQRFKRIDATLGCDCILRRLEMVETHQTESTENLLKQLNFIGFSTYGEQFNGIHVNQTLVGVVLGEKT